MLLRVLGMPEEEIIEAQAFAAGLVIFSILLLIIAVLAKLT